MSDANDRKAKYHLLAVKDALKALLMKPDEAVRKTTITYRPFIDPLSDERTMIKLPGDATRPESENLDVYITKLIEYVQCFLVTHRLAAPINMPFIIFPPELSLERYVKYILKVVGRNSATSRDSEFKYYPRPYVSDFPNAPFVDFAASLIVMLIDYIVWIAHRESDTPVDTVEAEVHTAVEFLLDAAIDDEHEFCGWGFVPEKQCAVGDKTELNFHRHVFPTAEVICAYKRFCSFFENDGKVGPIRGQLQRTLNWLKKLANPDPNRFYFASEEFHRPWLDDHLYATKALLELHEQGLADSDILATDAMQRLILELHEGWTADLENMSRYYRIAIKNANTVINYEKRSCLATCLTILSLGVRMLGGASYASERTTVKKYCNRILTDIQYDKRNEDGLWPKENVQFNWVLAAIDALLCYEVYAESESIRVTVEHVIEAADRVLQDKRFIELFRKILVEQIQSGPGDDLVTK